MQNKEKSKEKQEKEAVINAECPCDEPGCPRHGKCAECQKYHREHLECGSTACGK